jgi:hypothetical protein
MSEGWLFLLATFVILMVFGLAVLVVLWLFGVVAGVWTGMVMEVARDTLKRFGRWLNQPCCDKPQLEWSIISGLGLSRCLNCGQTKTYVAYPF